MLRLLPILAVALVESADYENARIIGVPKITCSKKSVSMFFETNIPFQGRISVLHKLYIPECNSDFSMHIQKNATFRINLERCMEATYLTNGSRLLTAHVQIGFHPLVITGSDRIFRVECLDNSLAVVRKSAPKNPFNCTHLVRLAARWEHMNMFHVGDSVVHEWTCQLPATEVLTKKMFLTSCNALSQFGQIIHLVDENGCIVDPELMGDLVYNNNFPKIYARAKMFKLLSGERFRIECILRMCDLKTTCAERTFPPKCSYTKDEIIKKHETRQIEKNDDGFMAGNLAKRFDTQVTVSSEWIDVHQNQYTNVDQLHERYFVRTEMDLMLLDDIATQPVVHHFLMSISDRDSKHKPKKNNPAVQQSIHPSFSSNPQTFGSPSFHPANPPIFDPDEDDSIETISRELSEETTPSRNTVQSIEPFTAPTKVSSMLSSLQSTNFTTKPITTTAKVLKNVRTTTRTPSLVTNSASSIKTLSSKFSTARPKSTSDLMKTSKPVREEHKSAAKISFYTTLPPTKKSSDTKAPVWKTSKSSLKKTTESPPTTTEMQFAHSEVFKMNTPVTNEIVSTIDSSTVVSIVEKDKFVNLRDWRLDDRSLNDTDIFHERQISCSNATIVTSESRCTWSGWEHLLLLWSFGSIFVWIVMFGVCIYSRNTRKDPWKVYRENELKRTSRARVLPKEHPWLHADAFEEPKLRHKHEMDMCKF